MKKNKKKQIVVDVWIDGDSIPYVVCPPATPRKDGLEGEIVSVVKPSLKILKTAYKDVVKDFEDIAAVECAMRGWKLGSINIALSDPKGCFRNDIFPEYKANRKGREYTDEFYKIRNWAMKKYGCQKGFEADDIAAYHVRNGAIGFSIDKDLLYGVEGLWFNSHHMHRKWVETSKESAMKFNFHQTLAGDPDDNILGLKPTMRIALTTAEAMLNGDYTWDNVFNIYETTKHTIELEDGKVKNWNKKAATIDDAILTRRLIGMDQVVMSKKGKYKLKLWEPPKRDPLYDCMGCGNMSPLSKYKNVECDGDVFGKCPSCKKNHVIMESHKVEKGSLSDGTVTTPSKSSKTVAKKVEEKKVGTVKRRTTKRKDTELSGSAKGLQKPSGGDSEKRYDGYYKSCIAHKDLITEAVYNKLPPAKQKEWSPLAP